ncbi:hypothetical protein LAZ67_4003398 [Cordylochernes scorpioides]|uniref:Histone-lysine N-methyltransferase SETMAR n=1 Tax=Cordylochernes scorpioides TaxID=51811 RepID=A0ABY6KGN3_9ARAC|nr:hypothetical protein LAZ67_4003398 [Cordylochernes scorpioides]
MNSDLYCDILVNKLKPGIRNKRRGKRSKGVLFLHDNARQHTSCKTVSTIIKLGFEVLEHSAYSPDLAPSDYFLFGLLKKELKGKRFDSDEDVQKVRFYSRPVLIAELNRLTRNFHAEVECWEVGHTSIRVGLRRQGRIAEKEISIAETIEELNKIHEDDIKAREKLIAGFKEQENQMKRSLEDIAKSLLHRGSEATNLKRSISAMERKVNGSLREESTEEVEYTMDYAILEECYTDLAKVLIDSRIYNAFLKIISVKTDHYTNRMKQYAEVRNKLRIDLRLMDNATWQYRDMLDKVRVSDQIRRITLKAFKIIKAEAELKSPFKRI